MADTAPAAPTEAALRAALAESYLYLSRHGLLELNSGNVSCRFGDGILISPNGASAETIRPGSFVAVAADGSAAGSGRPSSETPMHLAVYARVPEAGAIVHTHSDHCTALACCGLGIPGFHYLVGGFGGDDIPCVPYATFGSAELAELAGAALARRKGCLLGNHGAICHDRDIAAAAARAHRLESIARQYLLARQAGTPLTLTAENWRDYHAMAAKFRYG
ncbi:class II aldolase/adducin family protein [Paralimibaculum aggregatum]|uniref:Class II aldolase/adducin family protein n=1 Tax=Paralimibaculum aggregatum TaxID=3036245 RepID=A0ABQ6LSM6_9RHOB|nr:class II aldolase/adducin family protein [Limibaculum sp. NKW23]GMG85079.1 class II aldolase/adducin family protein [Limibaculum sp. NKW23]